MQYVAYLASKGLSSATIKVYLSALRFVQISSEGKEIKQSEMSRLKYVTPSIKKNQSLARLPSERQGKLLVTPSIVMKIRAVWERESHNYTNIMLWAVASRARSFRLGKIVLGDREKLDERLHLSARDISVDSLDNPSMMQVHLKLSKTDQMCKGVNIIIEKTGSSLCPVVAL